MPSQLTISKAAVTEPGLDQQKLYALGLSHVRRLARRIWTDHNVHDPGITTLELLCYALTDLTYRASLPLEDLLATESGNAENMKEQFFTARQILPNRPLTELDYRKLLIDLEGVKNAWIKPAALTYYADVIGAKLVWEKPDLPGIRDVHVRGTYRVLIEYMDDVTTQVERDRTVKSVIQRLHANRSLCEDFVGVTAVERQDFILCGELELSVNADAARVQAEVLFQVQQYLAPPVRTYSLSDMLERRKPDGNPYTTQEIFDGPVLDCGFIDDAELAEADLRTEIRLSDIISVIMDIKGVLAVRELIINPAGTKAPLDNKWLLEVEPNKQPALDRKNCRLSFYKRNMPVTPPDDQVDAHYETLSQEAQAKIETPRTYDLPIPLGKHRPTGRYHSFQNHFPAIYGLGEHGLPSGADGPRKALAYQLKAYLLFFDQVMADYCAQLSRVKDLFSTDPNLYRTYFYQVVDSFADFEQIYDCTDIGKTIEAVEDSADMIERRNRFLDHLVARFAERFHEYATIMQSAFNASPQSLVRVKCEFLKSYPTIASERNLGYNYSLKEPSDLWNTYNVSGLERRLAKLLGIANPARRNLSDITYDIYAEIDTTPGNELRFRVRHRETGKIILSSSTKYTTPELAREEMKRALRFAQMPAGYQRKVTTDGKHYFNVIDDTGEVLARRIEYFATEELMNAVIEELIVYVTEHYSDEGMFLMENILLRPYDAGDPFLPICVDPNCTDCADDDPYSYRVHIVLPAYAGRFDNMDFRRFAEDVIRQETPAHILPKICWIGKDDMARLEKAYQDWIEIRAGASTTAREDKLREFAEALYAAKNVYPVQKLVGLDSTEEKPRFILGQTAIGSMKTGEG